MVGFGKTDAESAEGRRGPGEGQRRGIEIFTSHPSSSAAKDGAPVGLWWGEEGVRASNDAHFSDDGAVAKMGHPVLWWVLCDLDR
jgi:hypothetical protein